MTTWTPVPSTVRYNRVHEFTRDDITPCVEALDEIMGMDAAPIQVHADGTLTSRRDVYVPEVYAQLDDEGSYVPTASQDADRDLAAAGWEPLRGYSGQYGVGRESWFMHASEFIGGGLARDILATPGVYATVEITPETDDENAYATEWAVIRRTTTD